MSEVAVIGGGAAGMMAAIAAARNGHRVTVYEKNEKTGKKLYITGKGRCNLTNACEVPELFDKVRHNPKFLYSAFYGFDNRAVMDFFAQAGCPVKVERGERVFPVSDHASDVIQALNREMRKQGVAVRLKTPVRAIRTGKATALEVETENGDCRPADAVILCTGGLSYPATGSTGDGYRMARKLGHRIVPTAPSLVSLKCAEAWCAGLEGLSLKNVSARMLCGDREIYRDFGEMLFTRYGVSGPLILSASSYYQDAAAEGGQDIRLQLDLKPALTEEQLDKRLVREFEENRGRQFKNSLGGLFPARLIPVMISLAGIEPHKQTGTVTREERRAFAALIKKIPINITAGGGYEEAIITKGGITVKEVDPSTMQSRLIPGLYLAGEVLDLDALTGGFNLQIAWSTGYLAGSSVL